MEWIDCTNCEEPTRRCGCCSCHTCYQHRVIDAKEDLLQAERAYLRDPDPNTKAWVKEAQYRLKLLID